jgi:hypothetical protein
MGSLGINPLSLSWQVASIGGHWSFIAHIEEEVVDGSSTEAQIESRLLYILVGDNMKLFNQCNKQPLFCHYSLVLFILQ